MGLPFVETLSDRYVYKCRCCRVDSASHDSIISKDFHGRSGRAYLFKKVVNISLGPDEDRHMMTGLHTVNDIYCSFCQQLLGWRYIERGRTKDCVGCLLCGSRDEGEEKAYEESQKYKEGKFILEKAMVVKESKSSMGRTD